MRLCFRFIVGLKKVNKQTFPWKPQTHCGGTAEEVSYYWYYYRLSSV